MCIRKLSSHLNKSTLLGVTLGAIFVITFNAASSRHAQDGARTRQTNVSSALKIESGDAIPLDVLSRVYDVANCKRRPQRHPFAQRGGFWILNDYVKARRTFRCYESVTYATHGDFGYLDNLAFLAERWKGPISVALYAPGDDFQRTLDSIAYLRNCATPLIREHVTFHVFFGTEHLPEVDFPLRSPYPDRYDCRRPPPFSKFRPAYRTRHRLPYPANVARNIAREAATTHYILSSDIELYPTPFFIPKFMAMAAERAEIFRTRTPKVFVLPAFEVVETALLPENRTFLQKMLKEGTAALFQGGVCPRCHRALDADKWLSAAEGRGLGAFAVGRREGLHAMWEPVFVGTHGDPLFDERVALEGGKSRTVQAYAMCLLNYKYIVLDNAFLIHRPGIKKKQRKDDAVEAGSSRLFRTIKEEFRTIFGRKDECQV